jgi:hypothetical protein
VYLLGERFGSGDGERKTLLTRQIAFEPPCLHPFCYGRDGLRVEIDQSPVWID